VPPRRVARRRHCTACHPAASCRRCADTCRCRRAACRRAAPCRCCAARRRRRRVVVSPARRLVMQSHVHTVKSTNANGLRIYRVL